MEGRPERKNVNETGSLNEHRQFYWAKSYAPGGTSDAFHRILSDRDSRQGLIIRTPVSLLFTVRAASYETLFLYHMPFSLELSFQPTLISMHYPMLMVHSMPLRSDTQKRNADGNLCDHKRYRCFYSWYRY